MKKLITLTLLGLIMSVTSFALDPIRGITNACVGATSALSDTTVGGTWSSSDPSIASVGLSTGVVTGLVAGTTTITYTLGTFVTTTFTVSPTPGAISGTTTLCAGTTSTLTNPTPGGTWTCSPGHIATIALTTGVLSAHLAGAATVMYYTGPSCAVAASVTVNDTHGGRIIGPSSICAGDTVTVVDSGMTGGTWSTSDISVATVSSGGLVTGIAGGSVIVTHTTIVTCGTAITTHALTITTTTSPGTISGPSSVMAGSSVTLTESVFGGTWSSSNTAIATIGATTGVMTGVGAGTAIMSYTVTGCSGPAYATYPITVTAFSGPEPITGITSACVGGTSPLFDSTIGGTWSSSDSSIAAINTYTGLVTGRLAGTATITYTRGTYVTTVFTVLPTPGAISGSTTLCVGTTSTLTNPTSGGTWTCTPTYVATIDPITGVLSAHAAGSGTVSYRTGTSCTVTAAITVNETRRGLIIGPSSVCVGDTVSLYDSSRMMTGGTWSSSDLSLATISSIGIVTGISGGTVVITLTTTGSCGPAISTHVMTIATSTSPGTISGPSTVVVGSMVFLTASVSGGTWSSSNMSVAEIGYTSGGMTGVAAGTAIMSYTVSGCSGPVSTTYPISVSAFVGISGSVFFRGTPYYGGLKVWLIKYNPSTLMLSASDSQTVYSSGFAAGYSFATALTDSYRVKAAILDSSFIIDSGYIPTYHTSAFYWHDATVFYHTAGIGNINKDIDMSYGAYTSGPGFIAGDVTTGANKGTSSTPAVGMTVYVINSITGQLMKRTKTDAAGHYSFINLPVGQTYKVFPEDLGYTTFVYPEINLTSGAPNMEAASFVQRTISKKITPILVGVQNIKSSLSSIVTFPNPTDGVLKVYWETNKTEKGAVVITDITGRDVYSNTIEMQAGAGITQLDLSGISNGLYMVNIKSASLNYNCKIQVVH